MMKKTVRLINSTAARPNPPVGGGPPLRRRRRSPATNEKSPSPLRRIEASLRAGRVFNLWSPVVGWCGLLFYLSSVPNLKASTNPFWDEIIRSGVHLAFYTILYCLFFRALNFGREKKDFWWPFFLTAFYGFSDEVHQTYVPTRTFQARDLVIDFSGAFLGGYSLWKLLPKAPKKLKNWARKLGLI